jgi:hypothetical protein
MTARALWTVYVPQGSPSSYALISDPERSADPKRAQQIEKRWQAVAGEHTTLSDVLEAKRSTSREAGHGNPVTQLMAGASFLLLEELPPAEDLTFAALSQAWRSVQQDLARLDAVDDVDLGLAVAGGDE